MQLPTYATCTYFDHMQLSHCLPANQLNNNPSNPNSVPGAVAASLTLNNNGLPANVSSAAGTYAVANGSVLVANLGLLFDTSDADPTSHKAVAIPPEVDDHEDNIKKYGQDKADRMQHRLFRSCRDENSIPLLKAKGIALPNEIRYSRPLFAFAVASLKRFLTKT